MTPVGKGKGAAGEPVSAAACLGLEKMPVTKSRVDLKSAL